MPFRRDGWVRLNKPKYGLFDCKPQSRILGRHRPAEQAFLALPGPPPALCLDCNLIAVVLLWRHTFTVYGDLSRSDSPFPLPKNPPRRAGARHRPETITKSAPFLT